MKVLITGGARGIGRAIARKFASQGAALALTYRSDEESARRTAEELSDEFDVQVECFCLDVTKSAAVDEVLDEVIARLDGLDVVVNNAGTMDNQAAAMMSDEAWQTVIDTNLTGPFFVARAVLTHFMMQRSGRIVNISSIAQDGASGQANYGASKAGLIGLTKSLAREYGPRGITVNAVVPGLIETEFISDVDPRLVEHWGQFCPARRLGQPEDVADAVWYLSRPEASFVNGAVLHVSGGLDVAP